MRSIQSWTKIKLRSRWFSKILRMFLQNLPVRFLQHLRLEVDFTLGFGSGTGNGILTFQDELKFLKSIAKKPVNVIFDVGANRGFWSQSAMSAFPQATVYAFEPNPLIFDELDCLELLKSRGKAYMNGFGSQEEERILHFNSDLSLVGSLIDPELSYAINNLQKPVQIFRMDDFILRHNLPFPDFIKIDVEGWEFQVMLGLGLRLSEVKYIQFEISEGTLLAHSSFSKIQSLLIDNQFRIFRHSPIGLIEVRNQNIYNENYRTTNYLAINKVDA